jgi:HK97 family phage major capsid protein
MGLYDQAITRTSASILVPREDVDEIFSKATYQSAVMQLFRRVPVNTDATRIKVRDALPIAYWVSPKDSGLKSTTSVAWKGRDLFIEELAAIIPIPTAVADDVASGRFSLNAEIAPLLAEAVAVLIDNTVFFGDSAPSTFPSPIVTSATAVGNTYSRGTSAASAGGLAQDINKLMELVDGQDFTIDGWATTNRMKSKFRSSRDTTGQKLADFMTIDIANLFGSPITYCSPDVFPKTAGTAELIGIERRQFVFALRQEMRLDIFTEGVITDADNNVILNLMQQDHMAIRMTLRCGWQCANPVTRGELTEASRYPAGVLLSPA